MNNQEQRYRCCDAKVFYHNLLCRGFGDGIPQSDWIVASGSTNRQFLDAGWSSLVARRPHKPKVLGSNPSLRNQSPRRQARRPCARSGAATERYKSETERVDLRNGRDKGRSLTRGHHVIRQLSIIDIWKGGRVAMQRFAKP